MIEKDQSTGEEYLVFTFSLVKNALAMDEAQMFSQVKVNFELRPDNLDSFSRIGNFPLSLGANMIMLALFFGIMYAVFPSLRTSVFGFFHSKKASDNSKIK